MKSRKEKDYLGIIDVPADRYWGSQTQRALENFAIGHERFPIVLIHSMAIVKKAAAIVNFELGKLDQERSDAIQKACDDVISEKLDDHFPLVIWQSGSGTQTNMNVNEVIANRAIEIMGGELGQKDPVHPNDHVNQSQSSNDVFPTAMHIAAVKRIDDHLLPKLNHLRDTFSRKVKQFADIIKVGRTHMMDATPITFGQEFSAYESQLSDAITAITEQRMHLLELAIGGSAVGTGLNTHPEFAEKMALTISKLTGKSFCPAPNKFQAIASHDDLVCTHGALKTLAVSLTKISNDIRLMASGPRCGLGEITLPANEPGSSIMPGKVNPSQCEVMTMIAAQVIGNDNAMTIAGFSGQLELNTYRPILIYNLLQSLQILADGCLSFADKCVKDISVNRETVKNNLQRSLMLITSLNGTIGYDNSAKVAKLAFEKNLTLKEACLELGVISEAKFDEIVRPDRMIEPRA